MAIPYAPDISKALSRILRLYNIQTAHVTSRKLRRELVNVKNKLQKERYPGVIYILPCADCQYMYTEESRNFMKRLQQHRNDANKKDAQRNVLAEHCSATPHTITSAARVLTKERNAVSRQYLESLPLQTMEPTLNWNAANLPPVYTR